MKSDVVVGKCEFCGEIRPIIATAATDGYCKDCYTMVYCMIADAIDDLEEYESEIQ